MESGAGQQASSERCRTGSHEMAFAPGLLATGVARHNAVGLVPGFCLTQLCVLYQAELQKRMTLAFQKQEKQRKVYPPPSPNAASFASLSAP